MKRVYGYLRVSTVQQGAQGVSLAEQRTAIARYAERHQLTVVDWFEEQETAAKRGRPVFARMLQCLRAGQADGVIIHKIDRSARHLKDWADLGQLVDEGLEIHFAHEGFDLNTRGGRLSADIQAVIAADFIRNLKEETRKGFYGRLKQGLYPLPAPLGYCDRGKGQPKAPDPARAPLVKQAFALYGSGRYNLNTLLAELTRMGLTNRNGGPITRNGLSRVLNNPFYMGLVRLASTGETFEGAHEPLISKALFDRVQAVLQGKFSAGQQAHDFLFRRRLHCQPCGYALIGERQKGHVYYRCHTPGCPTTGIREDAVDAQLQAAFWPVQLTEAEAEQLLAKVAELRANAQQHQAEQVAALELNRKRVQERLDRLMDAYLDQLIEKADYEARRTGLLEEKRGIEEKLAEAQADDVGPVVADRVQRFLELAKSLHTSYIFALPEEKRELVDQVTSNRWVNQKTLAVALRSPFQELAQRDNKTNGDPYRDGPRTTVDWMFANIIQHFNVNTEDDKRKVN